MTDRRPLRTRLADERGQHSLELLASIPLGLAVAVLAFQLAAVGGALTAAENAARAGSRALGTGGDAVAGASQALDPDMRPRARVTTDGPTVVVSIDVPVVIPLVDMTALTVTRDAALPRTTPGGP